MYTVQVIPRKMKLPISIFNSQTVSGWNNLRSFDTAKRSRLKRNRSFKTDEHPSEKNDKKCCIQSSDCKGGTATLFYKVLSTRQKLSTTSQKVAWRWQSLKGPRIIDEVGSLRRFVGSHSASLIHDLAQGGRKRSIRVLACAWSLRDCGYRQWQQAPREAWLGTARMRPSPFNADPPTGLERNGTLRHREYTAAGWTLRNGSSTLLRRSGRGWNRSSAERKLGLILKSFADEFR